MSDITKPVVLDETFAAKMDAQNHLLAHQNAMLDILVADKRAAALEDMDTIARLCASGEILEVLDYGDQIAPAWSEGNTNYNPAFNLCHESDEQLEDAEVIHGAHWEWDRTTPTGVPFDAPEALYAFDGTEGAGTFHIGIGYTYGDGWSTSKSIQFTLTEAPDAGDQLVVDLATNNATDPTNGRTWTVYGKGLTTAKQTGTTSNGTGGTSLGSTDSTSPHKANGHVNAPSRCVYGYNRYMYSALRQWLNSPADAGAWWTPQHDFDRPPAVAATLAGFLHGYSADVIRHFKPIKRVTVACDADGNVEDVTYDRVSLSSLEQMFCVPQFSGKEGEYWEYYKRLLGRTSPAPTSQTYPRLIKYGLTTGSTLSAQSCFRRSAYRGNAYSEWIVYSSGGVYSSNAYYANRCAPSVFISE